MSKAIVVNGSDFSGNKLTKTELFKKGKLKWEWRLFSHASGKDFFAYTSTIYSRIAVFGVGDKASQHEIPASTSDHTNTPYAIKIPDGATSVKISRDANKGNEFVSGNQEYIYFSQDVACGDSDHPDAIKYISEEAFDLSSNASVTISIPNNADACNVYARVSGSYDSDDDPNDVIDTLGVTIEFI